MLRTFLIRNGASAVLKNANKPCYLSLRQMSTLGTSAVNHDTVQKDEGLIVFFLGTDTSKMHFTLAAKDPKAGAYLKDKEMQSQSIVLAFRRFHGLAAVARFGLYRRGSGIDVKLTALVFDENMAALEVQLSADGENIKSAFPWTHSIVWSKDRASERQTNTDTLPELLAMGKATRIEINPQATVSGKLEFRDFDFHSHLQSQYDTFIKDLILNEESSNKND